MLCFCSQTMVSFMLAAIVHTRCKTPYSAQSYCRPVWLAFVSCVCIISSCACCSVKALHRKGVSLAALKDYAGAKEAFNAALVADPDNKEVKKQLTQSMQRQKREKAAEKKMAQKMFG